MTHTITLHNKMIGKKSRRYKKGVKERRAIELKRQLKGVCYRERVRGRKR